MRKTALFVLAALVIGMVVGFAGIALAGPTCTPDPGPQAAQNTNLCFPTPQECATGNYNGVYDGGVDGRGAICAGSGGHIVFYAGGNANATCGVIMAADQVVTGDPSVDPNTCPQ
jgi:hypothetical protein